MERVRERVGVGEREGDRENSRERENQRERRESEKGRERVKRGRWRLNERGRAGVFYGKKDTENDGECWRERAS